MDTIIAETNEEREKRLESTRIEVADLRSKLENSLLEMQDSMKQVLVQKTKHEVLAITRMTLESLASTKIEEQSIAIFLKRLAEQSVADKNRFVEAFKENT